MSWEIVPVIGLQILDTLFAAQLTKELDIKIRQCLSFTWAGLVNSIKLNLLPGKRFSL